MSRWGVAFIDCDSIKAAIRSAFASWSANHPTISFHDVTQDCKMAGDHSGGPGGGCSRAEIWLTTTSEQPSTADAAATTVNQYARDECFRHPKGQPYPTPTPTPTPNPNPGTRGTIASATPTASVWSQDCMPRKAR